MLPIRAAIRLRRQNRESQTAELRASQCKQRAQMRSDCRLVYRTVVPGIKAPVIVAGRYPHVFIANSVISERKVFQRPVVRIHREWCCVTNEMTVDRYSLCRQLDHISGFRHDRFQ